MAVFFPILWVNNNDLNALLSGSGSFEDKMFAYLRVAQSQTGAIDDMLYTFLGTLGYTGTIEERMQLWYNDNFATGSGPSGEAPIAPIITLLASSDRGASTSDGISNDPHPVFGLVFDENAAAGDLIRQKLDGVTNGDPYELQAADLTNGFLPADAFDVLPGDDTYSITFTHEKAGAESLPSNEISYVLNRSLGTVTAALDGVPGDDTGDTTPTINVGPGTYTFTEDDIAEVRAADGTVLGTRTITAGDVTAEIAPVTLSTLALGSHTLTAYIYRGGLFTSTTAKTIGVVVGPNAPLDLYVTPADQGSGPLQTENTQPTIRVEIDTDAEEGWDVTLVVDDADNATGTLTGTDITNGYADIQVTAPLTDNTLYDFSAYVTDDVGVFGVGIAAVTVSIGDTAFDPADLPNVALILDASVIGSMFQSNAGSTAVASSGDPVGYWADQSPNGFHLTSAADDGTRPAYTTTDFPHVLFDGTDDILRRLAALGMYSSGACSVFIALRGNPTADEHLIAEGRSSSNTPFYSIIHASGSVATTATEFVRDDAFITVSQNTAQIPNAFNIADHVVGMTDSGSGWVAYLDGVQIDTGSYTRSGSVTLDRFGLGGLWRVAGSAFFAARVYAVVIVTTRVVDSTERANITTWLGDKCGLSL